MVPLRGVNIQVEAVPSFMIKHFTMRLPSLSSRSAPLALCLSVGLLAGCATQPVAITPLSDITQIEAGHTEIAATNSLSGSVLAGRAASIRQDYRAAATFYDFARMADPDETLFAQRALDAMVLAGRMDETADVAARILEDYPQNTPASFASTMLAVKDEIYEDALAHVIYLDSFPASRILRPVIEAWASAGLGDLDAVDQYLLTLENEPGLTAFAQMHRAMIGHYLDLPTADRDLDLAIGASGEVLSNRLVRFAANRFAAKGDVASATAILEQALSTAPNDANLQGHLANLEAGLLEAPTNSPAAGIAAAFQEIAEAISRDRTTPLSAQLMYWSVYLNPEDYRARQALASTLYDLEWYTDAIQQAQKIPVDAPEYWLSTITVARSLNALERRDEGIAVLKGLDALRPTRTDALNELGFMYRQEQRFDDAAAVYSRALDRLPEVTPADWTLYYFRGIAYERGQQWPKAEADFLVALELSNDHPQVLNYLGYSWVEQRNNLDEAFEMIEKAVEQRPRDGYIVDSLGWAHYILGNYEEALVHLVRAVELMPDDPILNDHLGDAFWQVGRFREARFQWERALIFDPTDENRAIIEDKLENGLQGK